ncbi:MAG: hypothetical protein AAF465_12580 [Pseudomonadota bacterium]
MNAEAAPTSYKVIAIVALIWNILGLLAFVAHLLITPDIIAAMPEARQALYLNAPGWLNVAFGSAVIGGTLGALGLVLKKSWSIPLLIVSLIGVLAQHYHSFFMSNTFDVLGQSAMVMPIVVIAICVFLVWFALNAKKKGYLS